MLDVIELFFKAAMPWKAVLRDRKFSPGDISRSCFFFLLMLLGMQSLFGVFTICSVHPTKG